jgi:hypothetical protein
VHLNEAGHEDMNCIHLAENRVGSLAHSKESLDSIRGIFFYSAKWLSAFQEGL